MDWYVETEINEGRYIGGQTVQVYTQIDRQTNIQVMNALRLQLDRQTNIYVMKVLCLQPPRQTYMQVINLLCLQLDRHRNWRQESTRCKDVCHARLETYGAQFLCQEQGQQLQYEAELCRIKTTVKRKRFSKNLVCGKFFLCSFITTVVFCQSVRPLFLQFQWLSVEEGTLQRACSGGDSQRTRAQEGDVQAATLEP